MIAYSIAVAKLSEYIDRIVVSTDDKEIVEVAERYRAEVPFMRPEELAGDTSPDIEFIDHALKWLQENEGDVPDYIVHLRPTTPLRDPKVVDEAIKKLYNNNKETSLRSAHELSEPPQKYFRLDGNHFVGFLENKDQNLPRQSFPAAYHPNGYVDVLISQFIEDTHELHGDKILSFVTANTGEIDRPEDLVLTNFLLNNGDWEVYKYLEDNFKD